MKDQTANGTRAAWRASAVMASMLVMLVTMAVLAPPANAIVGGTNADPGEYPFNVALSSPGGSCGGSLVHPNWVLTAGHCIVGADNDTTEPTSGMRLLIGADDTRAPGTGEWRNASEAYLHPAYVDGDLDVMIAYDVALIRLDRPSTRTPVQMVSPTDPSDRYFSRPGVTATAIGRGRTSGGGPGSSQLREVNLTILSDAAGLTNTDRPFGGNTQVAAMASGRAACNGDSGGPLLVDTPTGTKVTGVASWVDGNCDGSRGSVYAEVSSRYLHAWVQQMIWETPLVGDFNGDGRDDVVTIDHRNKRAWVATSRGSSFSSSSVWHNWIGHPGSAQVVADVNGDDRDDLLVFDDEKVWVSFSNGSRFDGGFSQRVRGEGQTVLAGQVSVDDLADLVIVDIDAGEVRLRYGNGPFGFGSATTLYRGPLVEGTYELGDVDGDGMEELVVFEQGLGGNRARVLDGGSWRTIHDYFAVAGEVPGLGAVNLDAQADLLTVTRTTNGAVWTSLGTHWGHRPSVRAPRTFADADDTIRFGDFDGDGLTDLAAFTQHDGADVMVALNQGSGSFGAASVWHSYFAP